eukprot:UN09794
MLIEIRIPPPRDSNTTTNILGSGVQTNDDRNKEYEKNVLFRTSKNAPIKPSCLKSGNNPLTISRQSKLKELKVTFDEIVNVHTMPYWDPCGETFSNTNKCYDADTSKSYKVKTINHRLHKKLSIKNLFYFYLPKKKEKKTNVQKILSVCVIGVVLLICI